AARRRLVAERHADLLRDIVDQAITDLADENQTGLANRALALLALAGTGDADPVLDALDTPAQFPPLLQDIAGRTDLAALGPAATVAWTAATTQTHAAIALFYLAVAIAMDGDLDQAAPTLTQARHLDPHQTSTWINQLGRIGT